MVSLAVAPLAVECDGRIEVEQHTASVHAPAHERPAVHAAVSEAALPEPVWKVRCPRALVHVPIRISAQPISLTPALDPMPTIPSAVCVPEPAPRLSCVRARLAGLSCGNHARRKGAGAGPVLSCPVPLVTPPLSIVCCPVSVR